MYAIIEVGGRQYKVEEGSRIRVESLPFEPGATLEFNSLLLRRDDGSVELGKGKVVAKVLSQGKGKKLIVFKFRAKKNYKRWKGHRQPYTEILIKEIKEA
ncbi:MAG: 50S ribosomal protein L21 [Aquificaceae bacterium]